MLSFIMALALTAAPGKTHRTKIAVLDVEDVTGSEAAKAKLITQVLVGELPKQGDFDVLGASEIRSMIGFEKQKSLLGCHEDSCLAELGGAMGVDFLMVGQLGKLGSRYRFDLRLINAEKSRVAASEGDFVAGNDDALADAVVNMERKLLVDAGLETKPNLATTNGANTEPAGGLSETATTGTSHGAAWAVTGVGLVLAAGATAMTILAVSRYNNDKSCQAASTTVEQHQSCTDSDSPDLYSHLADGLWAGTLVAAGISTYLWLRPSDSSGAGGEIGVSGHF